MSEDMSNLIDTFKNILHNNEQNSNNATPTSSDTDSSYANNNSQNNMMNGGIMQNNIENNMGVNGIGVGLNNNGFINRQIMEQGMNLQGYDYNYAVGLQGQNVNNITQNNPM